MNSQNITLAIIAMLSASIALADDFKTMDGKEYKDAKVTHVEPDGIVIKTKSGISKIYFQELPKEVQQRFNYNPQQAAAFVAAENASYAATQNQQQNQLNEAQRQQTMIGQNLANIGQQQERINAIAGLEGRLAQVQSQEAILEQKIHTMETWHLGRLELADLNNFKRQLADLRREERDVRSQLNQLRKAQR